MEKNEDSKYEIDAEDVELSELVATRESQHATRAHAVASVASTLCLALVLV